MANTSKSKKQTAAKKTAAKKGEAKVRRTGSERAAIEIFGIVLVALGALFGIYLYSGADGVLGNIINSFLLGMNGVFAYAVPVILVVFGFFVILSGRRKRSRGTYLTAIIAVYMVICLLHLITSKSLLNVKQNGTPGYTFADYFMQWIHQFPAAWEEAVSFRTGGGVLGMLLMTPLYMLGGKALCYIVAIAGLLICLLLLTGISIKAYTELFGTKVKDKLETVKNEYFAPDSDDEYEDEDDITPAPRNWKKDFSAKRSTGRKDAPGFDEIFDVPAPEPEPKPASAWRAPETAPVPPVTIPRSTTPKTAAETKRRENRPDPDSAEFMPSTAKVRRKSNFLMDVDEEDIPTSFPTDEPEKTPAAPVVEPPKKRAKKTAEPAAMPNADADEGDLVVPDAPADASPLYLPPPIDCLNKSEATYSQGTESPEGVAKLLEETLQSFNISAQVVNYSVGPVVTRYELKPAPGIRVSKIAALADDLALALAAARVRIEAPIPGKSAVGIEVPNKETATVLLRDIIESPEFQNAKSTSTMAMGKDISGKVVVADLEKMPHMLIAGSTGSGKSVCINDIIISMVYKASPQEVQMILIDPKVVELSVFGTLPHLRVPVVTEPKKAASALRWAVNEMDQRYRKFSEVGARKLSGYNAAIDDPKKRMGKLVIIIDELADLMMVAPEDVEDSICRIAQLGRAAGIHLIVATQRPSADIITGLIKANIPSRCAFAVSSSIDSRIILDATGAEKLLGRGDMLFHPNGAGKPTRCQGAFVSDEEVERVMAHFKRDAVQFDEEVLNEINNEAKGGAQGGVFGEGKQEDELLGEAVRIVMENGQASISMIQRRLRVGYARAARLVDMMEQAKYVSGFDGSKPRQVLITQAEFNRVFGGGEAVDPEPDGADDVPFDDYEENEE